MAEMEGVVSVFRSLPRKHRLHTTRSWDFISLLEGGGEAKNPYEELLQKASYGKDVIVGVLDSGTLNNKIEPNYVLWDAQLAFSLSWFLLLFSLFKFN